MAGGRQKSLLTGLFGFSDLVRTWYHHSTDLVPSRPMATNLRLGREAEEAVRREAQRTGRSQQDVIREAVDHHLGLSADPRAPTELDEMVAAGVVSRPRSPYRKLARRITLPSGMTSADLLDRDDRLGVGR
jgi:hypothetical protein